MVSSGMELSSELNTFHSLSRELPIAPYFPEVGALLPWDLLLVWP